MSIKYEETAPEKWTSSLTPDIPDFKWLSTTIKSEPQEWVDMEDLAKLATAISEGDPNTDDLEYEYKHDPSRDSHTKSPNGLDSDLALSLRAFQSSTSNYDTAAVKTEPSELRFRQPYTLQDTSSNYIYNTAVKTESPELCFRQPYPLQSSTSNYDTAVNIESSPELCFQQAYSVTDERTACLETSTPTLEEDRAEPYVKTSQPLIKPGSTNQPLETQGSVTVKRLLQTQRSTNQHSQTRGSGTKPLQTRPGSINQSLLTVRDRSAKQPIDNSNHAPITQMPIVWVPATCLSQSGLTLVPRHSDPSLSRTENIPLGRNETEEPPLNFFQRLPVVNPWQRLHSRYDNMYPHRPIARKCVPMSLFEIHMHLMRTKLTAGPRVISSFKESAFTPVRQVVKSQQTVKDMPTLTSKSMLRRMLSNQMPVISSLRTLDAQGMHASSNHAEDTESRVSIPGKPNKDMSAQPSKRYYTHSRKPNNKDTSAPPSRRDYTDDMTLMTDMYAKNNFLGYNRHVSSANVKTYFQRPPCCGRQEHQNVSCCGTSTVAPRGSTTQGTVTRKAHATSVPVKRLWNVPSKIPPWHGWRLRLAQNK